MGGAKERSFTIEDAASILGCNQSTVYRLLSEGWLKRPVGWGLNGERARVSDKSLFQLIIFDRVSRLPARFLKELKSGRKKVGRIFSQTATANCLSIDEGRGQVPETPDSNSKLKEKTKRQRCLHHDTAVERQFSFGWLARKLVPNDPALQDDLVQETSLAVLEYNEKASPELLFEIATNRAKNYLEYEALRGMLPLSEARHMSDKMNERLHSLNHLIDELLGRGVPSDWIEEVLGQKLDVA